MFEACLLHDFAGDQLGHTSYMISPIFIHSNEASGIHFIIRQENDIVVVDGKEIHVRNRLVKSTLTCQVCDPPDRTLHIY